MAEGSDHVLIVEDNALVVGALRILLEEQGYRVSAAASVQDAIPMALEDRPDALVLDLTLPDGDGLAVLERLIDERAQPRVTVALTGHDDAATRERCLRAGCRAVLVKPMSALGLPKQIAGWLGETQRA